MNKKIFLLSLIILSILVIIPSTYFTDFISTIDNDLSSTNKEYNYYKYYNYDNIADSERQIWNEASEVKYQTPAGNGSSHDPIIAYNYVKNYKKADCFGMTAYLYYRFNFEEHIPARDVVCTVTSSTSRTHHSIQLYINGQWINPYYGYNKIDENYTIGMNTINDNYTVYRNPPDEKGNIPEANIN